MAVVLVADDDEAILKLVCMLVRSAGHKCLPASNGIEAVALFRSNADSIELVITDMVMPVMNGAQAVARIRQTRPEVRVICMTGYTDDDVPAGAVLLNKPFAPRELLEAVNRALGA